MATNKTIDKFGRKNIHDTVEVLRSMPGIGYKLTPSGDYNIQGKRRMYLSEPIDKVDAVAMQYADDKIHKTVEVLRSIPGIGYKLTPSGDYNIQEKRIINLSEPIDKADAVTMQYADYKIHKLQDLYTRIITKDFMTLILAKLESEIEHNKPKYVTRIAILEDQLNKFKDTRRLTDISEHILANVK